MREIRQSGSEGGARSIPCPYPYQPFALPELARGLVLLCRRGTGGVSNRLQ
jgi:hypothetical protein